MDAAPGDRVSQDRQIDAVVRRERGRLLAFIRRRIDDAAEAEDILQEALSELVAAYRLAQPVDQVGAWLTRVVRNLIIDRFRKRRPGLPADLQSAAAEGALLEELLPAPDGSAETEAMRELLLTEIEAAIAELPQEQRAVFLAQELGGVSFRELSARWGVGINTLLARKRYAVLHLRERLRRAYDEWLAD